MPAPSSSNPSFSPPLQNPQRLYLSFKRCPRVTIIPLPHPHLKWPKKLWVWAQLLCCSLGCMHGSSCKGHTPEDTPGAQSNA